jgi:hypothetical protein
VNIKRIVSLVLICLSVFLFAASVVQLWNGVYFSDAKLDSYDNDERREQFMSGGLLTMMLVAAPCAIIGGFLYDEDDDE